MRPVFGNRVGDEVLLRARGQEVERELDGRARLEVDGLEDAGDDVALQHALLQGQRQGLGQLALGGAATS
jgi:hypothetical protein